MSLNEFKEAIEKAKKLAKARKFKQTVDLIINYSPLSSKKAEVKINEAVGLPNIVQEMKSKVCVIAEGDLAIKAREVTDKVIGREELSKAQADRKYARNLANSFQFFIAQADLMPLVGKTLGPILGPRGKMPTPLLASSDPSPLIKKLQRSVRVRIKDRPIAQSYIGLEDMPTDQLAENARRIVEFMDEKLKTTHKVESIFVKLTMGPSIRVD